MHVTTGKRLTYMKPISEQATTATIQYIKSKSYGDSHPSAEDISRCLIDPMEEENHEATWKNC